MNAMTPGEQAWNYLSALAGITDDPPGLTRTFLSPAHTQAKSQLAGWMQAAGLAVFEDAAGNLIGRLEAADPSAPVFVCGSHIDTVCNAGRFDGSLGVVLGILAAKALVASGKRPTRTLEIVAFSDEEGVRFGSTYLGSKYYAGTLGEAELTSLDANGCSVRQAMRDHVPEFSMPPARQICGYIEVHIEQGPVLQTSDLALGVATSIAGQIRARVGVSGQAGHAGTTPMLLRRDALAGAAECILMIESGAAAIPEMVATVGDVRVRDGAGNVIPGHVEFPIDIRHCDDPTRQAFFSEVLDSMHAACGARRLTIRADVLLNQPATVWAPDLTNKLDSIVQSAQVVSSPRMVCGAGHDVVSMAAICPVALLLVRCKDGLSHHPDEFASPQDVAMALDVLTRFLDGEIFHG